MKTGEDFRIPEIRIGDTAPDFVLALAHMNRRLKSLSFTTYSPIPGVRERLAKAGERHAADTVTDFLHHDHRSNERWQVLVSDLTRETLTAKIASLPVNLALALNSKCIFEDGSSKYIPMMDFKPAANANNLELLSKLLEQMACKGIIVDSGASYHFYGFDFFDCAQWREFLGKCLLAPWSDSRWIGHSLIADGGDLRISATEQKRKLPEVSAILRR